MPTLQAHELYRFFHAGDDEVLALRGVSIEVNAGETVALVGPSGSGKSTLLACLAGIDEPDGGHVTVLDERLTRRTETTRASLRSQHIGILYQRNNLLTHLTVAQNVDLARSLSPRAGHTRRPTPDLLEDLHMPDRAHAYPTELSGGETARAGLAVALANEPAVLIADEPTGELDRTTEASLLELLQIQARQGTAVLVASHSRAVADLAERTVHLYDGIVTT